jgi:hypothetical protein
MKKQEDSGQKMPVSKCKLVKLTSGQCKNNGPALNLSRSPHVVVNGSYDTGKLDL